MCRSSFCSWKAELGWLLLNWGETGSWQKRTWGLHRASAAAVCLKASRVIAKCLHLIWPHLYGVRTLIYYSLTCIWAEGREGQSYEMELPTSVSSERTKWKEVMILYGFICFSTSYNSTGKQITVIYQKEKWSTEPQKKPAIVGLGKRQALKLSI